VRGIVYTPVILLLMAVRAGRARLVSGRAAAVSAFDSQFRPYPRHSAAILDELDFVKGQLAGQPTRKDLARMALATMIATAGLVLLGIELLSR
jgi:hypothetical protein